MLHARTDDISYVDFLQVDADDIVIYDNGDNADFLYVPNPPSAEHFSEAYRLYVDSSSNPQLVNGIDEYTLFTGIAYGN